MEEVAGLPAFDLIILIIQIIRAARSPMARPPVAAADPAKVTDVATYDLPARTAQGVRHVVVSGQVAVRDGTIRAVTAGRALRGGDTTR
jgi:N-acyl-D-amino-acid deacylase